MPKPAYTGPADRLEIYEKLVAKYPEIARKGAANPYTSMNGNMFSFLDKNGSLALRISDEDRAAFMKKHGTGPVVSHGAVMKGYVEVPASMMKNARALRNAFDKSIAYAETLEAKPTTRKAKATKKKTKKAVAKKTTKNAAKKKPAARKKAPKTPR